MSLFSFLLMTAAMSADWVVDAAGGGDFTGIQEALDASTAGDTIFVLDGTYTEGNLRVPNNGSILLFDHAVTVIGESIDGVVIQGDIPTCARTAAFMLDLGASCSSSTPCDVVLRNLTVVHDDAGTATATTGTYAYTTFKDLSSVGSFDAANLVVEQVTSHTKSILYANNSSTDYILSNLTINFGDSVGGVILYKNAMGGGSVLRNSIIYNTSGTHINGGSSSSGYGIAAHYNDLFGPASASGTNIPDDPLFVDRSGGNYHLGALSPAIDAGDPDSAYNDLDGSRNDMGAYGGAYAAAGDSDGDGIVDMFDVCPTDADPGQEDGDGDGIGDACDVTPTLVIGGTCPGLVTFDFSGFTPGGEIELATSGSTGSFVIGGGHTCAGTETSLSNDVRVRLSLTADSSGEASFQRQFYQSVSCGTQMQVLDVDTCTVTDEAQSLP